MARPVASSPAVAGFRPAGAALAVAAAFALQPVASHAQPSGAQVVHGQASIVRNGNNLSITTQNGAGTSHSAINWQSFSVPSGSVTHFYQPTATSTSINRVTGPDPSAIFGTLSSNGRLVLVNPAGIAVGLGAVVDTAGFTASTLGMSDADALAGRLRFGGGPGGLLQVDGRIVARSGDIVLIAPQVQTGTSALVESNGATIVAAGRKVEITGRGLEGIHMEVQAGNEAVNLGTLKGDAVGVFAHTLKHSGLVEARAVTTEGGKVVLKAIGGDALVDGRVAAAGAAGKGGQVDVLGERVALLSGAVVDVSGQHGGGQVRIGGDYQGANAAVPNAQRTYMDANARINADAIDSGNGGRVIVWADGDTRMHGQISARGGAAGGDGGFAEVSGKVALEFKGLADLRAPKGAMGTLLLDPVDVHIVDGAGPDPNSYASGGSPFEFVPSSDPTIIEDGHIEGQLALSNVKITTNAPGTGGDITMDADASITWNTASKLEMVADKNIFINGSIENTGNIASSVVLTANGGNVDVASGAYISAGTVSVTASQSITGDGNFRSFGRTAPDQSAGGVSLIANGGSVSFGSISATGTFDAPHGGKVVVTATGDVGGGWIESDGYYNAPDEFVGGQGGEIHVGAGGSVTIDYLSASGGAHSAGPGRGGMIVVNAGTGITIDQVSASGGAGYSFSTATAPGGMGGTVSLTSETGLIEVASIWANGGSGAGGDEQTDAMGGDVFLNAKGGSVRIGEISVLGGTAEEGLVAGKGGKVTIHATQDITIEPQYSTVAIVAEGGESYGGTGGDGGEVELKAGGNIVFVPPELPDEDLFAAPSAVPPPSLYGASISAMGGYGATAGTGGLVRADAGGNLSLGIVNALGGDSGSSSAGGPGGQGGNVHLRFGGSISNTIVGVLGGQGYEGGMSAGTGGKGGTIKLERTGTGDMVLDGSVWLLASGGLGGNADSAGGTPGAGGEGGSVELLAHDGKVILRSPVISAGGGEGGMNADETQVGATGAMGTFTAMGKSVEVESDFVLDAIWNNSSNVHVRNAVVNGSGAFRNLSDLLFYGNASMDVSGGVENKGRLTTFGNNLVNLTENHGFVDVVAGSTMFTPAFLANKGKVQVNGRLEIGATPPLDTSAALPSVSGATFVNESTGVLTGNGTIAVTNGSGLVNNFGTINPGSIGGTGILTLESSLAMQPGSTLAMDLLSTSSFDAVKVTGTVATGGTVAVNLLPGAGFMQGDTFAVIQSGALDASTMPGVNNSQLTAATSGNNLMLVAGSTLVPASGAEIQQVNNQVIQFAQLFMEEAERYGKDDIVVTDTSCLPR